MIKIDAMIRILESMVRSGHSLEKMSMDRRIVIYRHVMESLDIPNLSLEEFKVGLEVICSNYLLDNEYYTLSQVSDYLNKLKNHIQYDLIIIEDIALALSVKQLENKVKRRIEQFRGLQKRTIQEIIKSRKGDNA